MNWDWYTKTRFFSKKAENRRPASSFILRLFYIMVKKASGAEHLNASA